MKETDRSINREPGDKSPQNITAWVREVFENKWGRGWQTRLADEIGVAPSTLSGWLKSEKFPKWAAITLNALLGNKGKVVELVVAQQWRAVRLSDQEYAVFSVEDQIGNPIAKGIPDAGDAIAIAALPELFQTCNNAYEVLGDEWEDDPKLQQLRRELGATLRLADPDWPNTPSEIIDSNQELKT